MRFSFSAKQAHVVIIFLSRVAKSIQPKQHMSKKAFQIFGFQEVWKSQAIRNLCLQF